MLVLSICGIIYGAGLIFLSILYYKAGVDKKVAIVNVVLWPIVLISLISLYILGLAGRIMGIKSNPKLQQAIIEASSNK